MNLFLKSNCLFKNTAVVLVFAMTILGFVPRVDASFITTEESLPDIVRQVDFSKVQKALENKKVMQRLEDLGYTEQEIRERVAQLSDQEIHQLAAKIDSLNAAGDSTLVIIVLVVLLAGLLYLNMSGKKIAIIGK